MIPTKQQILDYLSDIIDREKAALDNTPDFEISKDAEIFRLSYRHPFSGVTDIYPFFSVL